MEGNRKEEGRMHYAESCNSNKKDVFVPHNLEGAKWTWVIYFEAVNADCFLECYSNS